MTAETHPGHTMERGRAWEKLWAMVKDIKVAMLTTVDGTMLRSRPMSGHASADEGKIWFFTKASSPKSGEIDREDQVNVAYANPDDQAFVSISGSARLVRDRAKIDQFWNSFVSAWFPEGKDDPDLALICVSVEEAEYWDGPSSKMVQLWKIASAKARGTEPEMGENKKL